VRCLVKVKEKYFTTKYTPAGIIHILKANAMIHFKFKLQLQVRKKIFKLLFYNCKFLYRFTLQIQYLTIKIRKKLPWEEQHSIVH
jgi:hypothetical protein